MEAVKKYLVISLFLIILVVAALAIIGLTRDDGSAKLLDDLNQQNGGQTDQIVQEGNVSVSIKNHAYGSTSIKVKKGTTVTWKNEDSVEHDVTPDKPDEVFKQSELLGKGKSYSVTFTEAGIYTYYCTPHPYMKGTVEVVD